MIQPRTVIAALTLSASALVGIAQFESYTDTAVIPVKGDVPTVGFGTTRGVKMGDTTTPPRALVRLLADADEYSRAVKRCAPVPMYQYEFDSTVSFVYNVGPTAFCNSTMAKKFRSGDYQGACAEILRWTYFNGRDCKRPENRCGGLAKRRQAEYRQCKGAA